MQEEETKSSAKKWLIIAAVLVVIIIASLFLVLRFAKDSPVAMSIGKVLPFGQLEDETPRGGDIGDISNIPQGDPIRPSTQNGQTEPLFRQLTNREIAGATTILRDGKTFIRYVLRENGHVFEINTETWATSELTNTMIPHVHEAFFGNNGDAVVFRYLKQDRYTGRDEIKTYVGVMSSPSAENGALREIRGEYLPINISAISVSPDGSTLFYLIPTDEGSLGFIKKFDSPLAPKEILRSSFEEWAPQLFDNGLVLLSTKPSANIQGFAYLYNPEDKSMTRLVREKNGLTTLGNKPNDVVLFGENIGGNATVGLYSKEGFVFDEGIRIHEASIPLTTIPEKCAWGKSVGQLYCASFSIDIRAQIPDDWYQGVISFADTFWMVYPQTQEIKMLADPKKEVNANFDVINPFLDADETKLFFTDKNTGFLWSMRIERPVDETLVPVDLPPPPPEEAGDAAGSR